MHRHWRTQTARCRTSSESFDPCPLTLDSAQVNILTLDPPPFFCLVFRRLGDNDLGAEGGKAIAKALTDPNCKVQEIE